MTVSALVITSWQSFCNIHSTEMQPCVLFFFLFQVFLLLRKKDDETCNNTASPHGWYKQLQSYKKKMKQPWHRLVKIRQVFISPHSKSAPHKISTHQVEIKAVKQQKAASYPWSFSQCLSGFFGGLNWLSGNWVRGKWAWISAEVLSSVHQPLQMRAISIEADSFPHAPASLHHTFHLFHPQSGHRWLITPLWFSFTECISLSFFFFSASPSVSFVSPACFPQTSTLTMLSKEGSATLNLWKAA